MTVFQGSLYGLTGLKRQQTKEVKGKDQNCASIGKLSKSMFGHRSMLSLTIGANAR